MPKEKNTTPSHLHSAVESLEAAAAAYEALTRTSNLRRNVADAADHTAACRKALADKRYAAAVVEALRRNQPAPDRNDLIECRE